MPAKQLSRLAAAAVAILGVAALPVSALADPSPDTSGSSAAIAMLNQQREANGIPAIANVNNSYASSWCPYEDTGPSDGDESRVLAGGYQLSTLTASSSPWSTAPVHQAIMYYPLVRTAGWAVVRNGAYDGGAVYPFAECMGFGDIAPEPATPEAYAFFSERGPSAVPATDSVYEAPFEPQQFAGFAPGTPTGPEPILYVLGIGRIRATNWSLVDESTGAAVPGVGMVTSYQLQAAGYSPNYLWDDAILVPPALQQGTVYDGRATFTGDGGECLTETFSFATLRADGSSTGAKVAPVAAKPCGGTNSATANVAGHRASQPASRHARRSQRAKRTRVGLTWSRAHGLVVTAQLLRHDRLFVKLGHRVASTRRGSLRLRWPYARTVVVWLRDASGTSSARVRMRVIRA